MRVFYLLGGGEVLNLNLYSNTHTHTHTHTIKVAPFVQRDSVAKDDFQVPNRIATQWGRSGRVGDSKEQMIQSSLRG